jgi:hypothetical protein
MRIFYCYSRNLKNYFKRHDVRYLNSNINTSTNKRYWMYEGTEELNNLLKQWRVRK